MAAIPAEFHFMAKRALADYPLIGTVIRKAEHSTIEKARMIQRLAGAEELARRLQDGELLMVFPEGTFVRSPGLLPFRLGAFRAAVDAILLSLVLWTGIVAYAYASLQTVAQAWVMGAVLATVLGGSQALSRSLFSEMIPAGHEASFFGLYEITERGTSWIGPLIFGLVVGATGSFRQAILSLIVLFLVGMAILIFTNAERAIHDAGNLLPTEAASAAHA